jgi:hypothetical protein
MSRFSPEMAQNWLPRRSLGCPPIVQKIVSEDATCPGRVGHARLHVSSPDTRPCCSLSSLAKPENAPHSSFLSYVPSPSFALLPRAPWPWPPLPSGGAPPDHCCALSPSQSSSSPPSLAQADPPAPLSRPRWLPASSTDGGAASSTAGARGPASTGPLHLSRAPQHLHRHALLLCAWGSQPLPPSHRRQHATSAVKPPVTVVRWP